MAKKALLIGINYPGTKAELKGCINDVWRMHECLIQRFGFNEEDIVVMIDTDSSYTQPTGANIRRAIADLVRSAQPDDVLFMHYSGHGTRLPAESGEDDDTGYDECIVPCDMNLITGLFRSDQEQLLVITSVSLCVSIFWYQTIQRSLIMPWNISYEQPEKVNESSWYLI